MSKQTIPQFAVDDNLETKKVQPICFKPIYKSDWHRQCRRLYQKNRVRNKPIDKEKQKLWQKNNSVICNEASKKWKIENIEKVKQYDSLYYSENKQKIKNRSSIYYQENKIKSHQYKKEWNKKNRDKVNKSNRQKYHYRIKNDLIFAISIKIKRLLVNSAKNNQFKKNSMKTFQAFLKCSKQEFRNYIQVQFKEGMTWENHGVNGWDFDHIIPISSSITIFDFIRLSHHTNFQPMWKKENNKKRDKIIDQFVQISDKKYYQWRIRQNLDYQI